MYLNEKAKTYYQFARHIKKYIDGLYISGSIRRKEEQPNDIDIITKRPLDEVLTDFMAMYDNIRIIERGQRFMKLEVPCINYLIEVDIWRAMDNNSYKFHKWLLDMDRGHHIYYKKQAGKYGLDLSLEGLRRGDNGSFIQVDSKKDLKRILHIN